MDRNDNVGTDFCRNGGSPPARVAWIETVMPTATSPAAAAVATREGGVDRNRLLRTPRTARCPSPPARVAWIETHVGADPHLVLYVATREGGVDRNEDLGGVTTWLG